MSKNNSEFAARLLAVQACYEMLQTKRALKLLVEEYLERGLEIDGEYEAKAKPKPSLFKEIIKQLDENLGQSLSLFEEHARTSEKDVESLLKAIALCGITELHNNHKVETALIIDEYLNVTHCFYEKGQVSYINGILDAVKQNARNAVA